MLSRGDAVVYKCRGMYKVEEIGTLDFSFADSKKKYYTLQSIEDARDKAYVPTDDEKNIRRPVSFEEAKHLLDCVDKIELLSVKNEKFREQEYKDCISDFRPENWVRVLRNSLYKDKASWQHDKYGQEISDAAGACPRTVKCSMFLEFRQQSCPGCLHQILRKYNAHDILLLNVNLGEFFTGN